MQVAEIHLARADRYRADAATPGGEQRTVPPLQWGCRNAGYVSKWANKYLKNVVKKLGAQMEGYTLVTEDVYVMQQLCAYETVALGYSKFRELFTEEEWDGFHYSLDLFFWHNSAFGFALAHPLGIGYVQELVAWLCTHLSPHTTRARTRHSVITW